MLATVWAPQRGSQIYTEKKRGRKETEVTRRRKGGIKRRETDQPVISSLSVLLSPEHTDSQSFVEKRRGREETEATWWRERRVQRGREQSNQ